eukprot:145174-Chlamydomonas_euryale.AAC.3
MGERTLLGSATLSTWELSASSLSRQACRGFDPAADTPWPTLHHQVCTPRAGNALHEPACTHKYRTATLIR